MAREHGYALALHGSMQQDLDLVAVPWVEDASEPMALVQALANHINGSLGYINGHGVSGLVPEKRPHGRLSWKIILGGGASADISVMPKVRK